MSFHGRTAHFFVSLEKYSLVCLDLRVCLASTRWKGVGIANVNIKVGGMSVCFLAAHSRPSLATSKNPHPLFTVWFPFPLDMCASEI